MISRRAKRLTLGFGFLIALVVLVLFSIQRYFANMEAKRRYEEELAQIKPRELYLVAAERRDGVRKRRYAAQVAPWIDVEIAAEVQGKVEEVLVDAGSDVEKGDILLRLDPSMAEIELAAAEAALSNAEAQASESARLLKEAEALAARNVISNSELESKRAAVQMSEADRKRLAAERDRLAENLDRHTIRAPFSGTVRNRLVNIGDVVNMNGPLVELVKLDPLRVVFHVSEFEVGAFRPGEAVRLSIAGMEGETFQPEVVHVSRSADPHTRLFRVEASLPNPEGRILGGTQGIVEASVKQYGDALFVPVSAVRLVGNRAMVEKINPDGETRMEEISIGHEVDGSYPVLSGLEEGEKVVVR